MKLPPVSLLTEGNVYTIHTQQGVISHIALSIENNLLSIVIVFRYE